MNIINTTGLPQAVFEALSKNEYSRGGADISVTELIDSARVRVLKKKHDEEIELEAEALLASFLGTCFHKGVEAGTKSGTTERRLSIEVNGWTLSGGMDHYDSGILTDYKTCNVFKFSSEDARGGRIEDFENQLNVYAHILRENGHPVKRLMIFALFKDWNGRSFSSARSSNKLFVPNVKSGYPEKNWLYFEVPLWKEEAAKEYVLERVLLHQKAEKSLPLCTPKEIWNSIRCKKYCNVNSWCDQFGYQSKTGLMKEE